MFVVFFFHLRYILTTDATAAAAALTRTFYGDTVKSDDVLLLQCVMLYKREYGILYVCYRYYSHKVIWSSERYVPPEI